MPWSVKAFSYGRGSLYHNEMVGKASISMNRSGKGRSDKRRSTIPNMWVCYSYGSTIQRFVFRSPDSLKATNITDTDFENSFSVTMLFWINFLYLIYITQFCSFLVPFKWIFNLATKITHLKIKQLNGIQLNANRPKFNQDFMNRP